MKTNGTLHERNIIFALNLDFEIIKLKGLKFNDSFVDAARVVMGFYYFDSVMILKTKRAAQVYLNFQFFQLKLDKSFRN